MALYKKSGLSKCYQIQSVWCLKYKIFKTNQNIQHNKQEKNTNKQRAKIKQTKQNKTKHAYTHTKTKRIRRKLYFLSITLKCNNDVTYLAMLRKEIWTECCLNTCTIYCRRGWFKMYV